MDDLVGGILRGALATSPVGPIVGAVTGAAEVLSKKDSGAGGDGRLPPEIVTALVTIAASQAHSINPPPAQPAQPAEPARLPLALPIITTGWLVIFGLMSVLRAYLAATGKDAGSLDFILGVLASGSILGLAYWVSSSFGSYSKTAQGSPPVNWPRVQPSLPPIYIPPTSGAPGGGSGQSTPSLPPPAPKPEPTPVPVPPVPAPEPGKLISDAARDLIVLCEVTSRSEYEARLARPTWPGGGSGVTIGIGYDVGAGVGSPDKLWNDWRGHLPDASIALLEPAIGVTGDAARSLVSRMQSVYVPWDDAIAVFDKTTIPEEYAKCVKYLPNFEALSLDCKGALVSLVYNRGPSFNLTDDRYREMRAIKAHMTAKEFDKIPGEIRSMKRIWAGKGQGGLLTRRDKEADLFQRGLTGAPAEPSAASGLPTGADLVAFARKFIGRPYRNVQVPKDDPNYAGAFDCAELASYVVFQVLHILYGCIDNDAQPAKADAYTGAWKRDAAAIGRAITVAQALKTPGAFLLRYPPSEGSMGHIAISDGKGGTVEAASTDKGVIAGTAAGRRWDIGVCVPGANYSAGGFVPVTPPSRIFAEGQPNMDPAKISEIQTALENNGFSPGEVDGEFGPATSLAVANFQASRGLISDGEVGPETAAALGVTI